MEFRYSKMEDMVNLHSLGERYKGKKIFLTGHTGFKGSWFLYFLHLLKADVKGYSLDAADKSLYSSIKGNELCKSVIADIRDSTRLSYEIEEFQPDFIFHFAAQALVRYSYDFPIETFDINAMGTANVIEATRNLKKKCSLIIITTDKVYENKEWEYAYREADRLGGFDPYSASKACAELIINSYRNSFLPPHSSSIHLKGLASARAGNVIGGGDWSKDRLIPDVARALLSNQSIVVRNPLSIRPWQHVLEPLTGYLVLGIQLYNDPEFYSQAWNFGPFPQDTLKVEEVIDIAVKSWGSGTFENANLSNQPHEANLLKLDISKSLNLLKWRPRWNAKESINETLTFYKSEIPGNARFLVEGQIKKYLSLK